MYKVFLKRVLDIIISLFALVLFMPLFLIIGILVKVVDGGKVFYLQNRTGKNGNDFKIYKFKSMKNGKVTKLGAFLRMTSLDELPQFVNVLKGDMSLVGPRPWIPEYYQRFNEIQKRRNNVKPGLVGLAQVNGRKNVDIFEKIKFDIEYVEKISLWMDIKIMIRSIKVLISKQDADAGNEYINKELSRLEGQFTKH